ncbi:hypothetical protein ASG37_12100 [Sphingomonas sp. Leaf407]|uniref:hypothetical protein n=1 Tax=unclassified Sphingomonas TaxID=196159 RepID=UPI0006F4E719|nr:MULTISPECIES: hypothetical protein [unclassified Sphingomonas]KQN37748.1 hypothetical protein ASE97_09390 [Sphingomonas sp. Leaf42]KQT28115.1 hypothetical protein ASG37_12100 [Sphingomonas sp. Leaf407]
MTGLLTAALMLAQPGLTPSGPPTAQGTVRTAQRLLEATDAGDDAAFQRTTHQFTVMFTGDFGAPATRADFAQILKLCTDRKIGESSVVHRMKEFRTVRLTMRCTLDPKLTPAAMVMDIMANDDVAVAALTGGIEAIWPTTR